MKISLFLLLLLSILNDVKLNKNILSQIEDVEDPILTANSSTFKAEAAKAIKNLFGISYNFDTKLFEKAYAINSNPKITVKLSSSCKTSVNLGNLRGYFRLRGGAVVSQDGTKVKLDPRCMVSLGTDLYQKYLMMMHTLSSKLKNSVVDGIIYFSFSSKGVKIEIIFDSKKALKCEGKLIIEISPGIKSKPGKELSTLSKRLGIAISLVMGSGTIASGTLYLYNFYENAGTVGGPVVNLIGVSS